MEREGSESQDPLKRQKIHHRSESRAEKRKAVVTVSRKRGKKVDILEEAKQLRPVDPDTIVRRYQLEVLEIAKRRNTIVYLETGCGKTLIAVLLMKVLAQKIQNPLKKRIAVFLVPKVILVHQQLEVIRVHTNLKAESYFGAKGVDSFDLKAWQKEVEQHEVLVMTPQVFLDALRAAYLHMDMVELLVLDECHHARNSHPYANIMKEFYHEAQTQKPKVFGMTASPVLKKGVSSAQDCEGEIRELERILDAQVFSPRDRQVLELVAPSPREMQYYYADGSGSNSKYFAALEEIRDKCSVLNVDGNQEQMGGFADRQQDEAKLIKYIRRLHGSVVYCIEELGPWCALKVLEAWLEVDLSPILDTMEYLDADLVKQIDKQKTTFLTNALSLLQGAVETAATDDVSGQLYLVTPKAQRLMEVLIGYKDAKDLHCIVFVDRIIGTIGLCHLINALSQLGSLSFLRCGYLTGNSSRMDCITRKKQLDAIRDFRLGKLNVIVATEVAEEGLDLQNCNSVIRFDLPKSVRSYIQSRGRGRQPGAHYIFLLNRAAGDENAVRLLQAAEEEMKFRCHDRTDQMLEEVPPTDDMAVLECYKVESTGAVVTTKSSVTLVYRYCCKLPKDRFYVPRPDFSFSTTESGEVVCTLKLPSNALIHEEVGPPTSSPILAKQVVCLKACEKLHKLGALDDYLRPVTDDKCHEESNQKPKRGLPKQKELHSKVATKGLEGCWGNAKDGVSLQAYVMNFVPNSCEDKDFSDFVLLLESQLDTIAAELSVKLSSRVGEEIMASLSPASKIHLNANELEDAKLFQQVLFNGLFSRLVSRTSMEVESGPSSWKVDYFSPSKESEEKLWSVSCMYLLLPLAKKCQSADGDTLESTSWEPQKEVAGNLKPLNDLGQNHIQWDYVQSAAYAAKALAKQRESADSLVSWEKSVDTAVVTRHTGRIYTVTNVQQDINGESAFPVAQGHQSESQSSEQIISKTYASHFLTKYGEQLRHPKDSFLRAKQSHRIRNMLIRSAQLVGKRKVGKKAQIAYLPPELCIPTGIPCSVINSAYLIPSVMHHLVALLQANQLQEAIRTAVPRCQPIPLVRIVEALTTSRCLEEYSLERLEMLGDSLLKYAISRRLFLVFQSKHEGQLTSIRSRAICNMTLYRLCVARNISAYIRDEVFDPKRWLAPGMKNKFESTCHCNLLELQDQQTVRRADANLNCKTSKENESESFRKVGKSCVDGHRWLGLKTMADTVEALIGAYYVYGGEQAAISFMTWIGIEAEFEADIVEILKEHVSLKPEVMESVSLAPLESKLGYRFSNKALFVEALTHASQQDGEGGRCYQRLEFLGDAVLDFMISRHLFAANPGLSPGQLTDLRSAAVNNDCFARVAVRHNLQHYLRHASRALLSEVEQFVRITNDENELATKGLFGWERSSGPKVLGDLVESIAGAIALDTGFDLENTWVIMKSLLAPLVTPDTLCLHPVREVQELCQLHGFSLHIEEKSHTNWKMVTVSMKVTAGNKIVIKTSTKANRKTARKDVAGQMLIDLKMINHGEDVANSDISMSSSFDEFQNSVFGENQVSGPSMSVQMAKPYLRHFGGSNNVQKYVENLKSLNEGLLSSKESLQPMELQANESKRKLVLEDASMDVSSSASDDNRKRRRVAEGLPHPHNQLEESSAGTGAAAANSPDNVHDIHPLTIVSCHSTNGAFFSSISMINEHFDLGEGHPTGQRMTEMKEIGIPQVRDKLAGVEAGREGHDDTVANTTVHEESIPCTEIFKTFRKGIKTELQNSKETGTWVLHNNSCQSSAFAGTAGKRIYEQASGGITEKGESPSVSLTSAKSVLFELCAKKKWREPLFSIASEAGPPHLKQFTCSVKVQRSGREPLECLGSLMYDKKKAEHSAALKMLERLAEA